MYFYCFFSFGYFDPYDHSAVCWVTLKTGSAVQQKSTDIKPKSLGAAYNRVRLINGRVAKFVCPNVLGDQKMSEDNKKLRSGCPPDSDYQIFLEKCFENNCPFKFLRILFSPFPFPTNI